MVVTKLLINLWHFLLLWKVFFEETPSVFFISTIHVKKKKIKFTLKVSLQETPSIIPWNWIYVKCISSKDIFS